MKIPPPPVDWSQLTAENWNKDKEKINHHLVKDLRGWIGQPEEDAQPPTKKPRIAKAKHKADKQDNADKMDMATILNPGSMTLQDNHPPSHTDTKVTQWLDNIKDKKLHTYVKKVVTMLTTMHKKDRPNLIETAIRYGVPMDKVQQMSYKSLSHVVAAGAYFAI